MARHRSSTFRRHTSSNQQAPVNDTTTVAANTIARPPNQRSQSARTSSGTKDPADEPKSSLPTIRFHPHQEIRNGRPSLTFSPVSRTLPSEHSIIRVGRYSEREGVPSANPLAPSDAPVGFKSKVVSRKHCEFCFVEGQWQIKDVASSSGTFLNHIRLSQPNTESRLFPIKDGDIVQLGIDFRGGEEMIFRCVKIRIECNRAWQKKPNNFKAYSDLAADVDLAQSDLDEWMEGTEDSHNQQSETNGTAHNDSLSTDDSFTNGQVTGQPETNGSAHDQHPSRPSVNTNPAHSTSPAPRPVSATNEANHSPASLRNGGLLARRQASNPSSSEVRSMNGNIEMPDQPEANEVNAQLEHQRTRTQTPDHEQAVGSGEGPLTPRNNAGPFVFDGSAGRSDAVQLQVPGIPEVTGDNEPARS
ncbi:uncharacterized protein A1O9_10469 [Exophiala aquamarina CBS 119918]|uniref:FHA domain-containing protein n=1 Tax=Exophiala aquamarina CBS 119918 TaxID=1182545 RepID=A0A072P046_9EURO|nr:uncharacterized protein A1O9_10469 [Exophiala aquamarina CBS 119918]KEF53494.1 hypothetical protein A1O9_10469 [Exophiala aquamarina CBS 119918]